jgi:hypothetical protein
MGSYSTKLSLPQVALGNSEAEFAINFDKKTIGTLRISKGSLDWFSGRSRIGKTITWKEFDELMKAAPGRDIKKKSKR